MSERKYSYVQVFGNAGGMNQMGWKGAIADHETTYSYNMSTTTDGEWKKRKGYVQLVTLPTGSVGETTKLLWRTNDITDAAEDTDIAANVWLANSSETNGHATDGSGNLRYNHITQTSAIITFDGLGCKTLYANKSDGYIKILGVNTTPNPDYYNYDATAGRLQFRFRASRPADGTDDDDVTIPLGGIWGEAPPSKDVYIFYFSSSFYMMIRRGGNIRWKYGAGATEYLEWNRGKFDQWYKMELNWDNSVTAATVFPVRFRMYVDGVLYASAHPTSAVTMSFDASTYWLNNGAAGTSAPDVETNWDGVYFKIALIKSYSDSGVTSYISPAVTGVHSHTSDDRAIVTNASSIFALSGATATVFTGTYTMGTVRTSAAEWLGNLYIADGTNYIKKCAVGDTEIATADKIQITPTLDTPRFIASYHGHLWIGGLGSSTSGDHSVRCSDIDKDNAWTLVNQVFKCRAEVRGIASYSNQLIVGTKHSIESISGYQPHDFTKTIVSTAASCASHWSMVEVPIGEVGTALLWAGYDGVYMMTGSSIQKISWKIEKFWQTLSKIEIEECSAVDNRETGEYLLSVSDGTSAENNWVLCFNYRKGDWSIWKYANNMDSLGWYYSSGIRVLIGGDSQGNLYHLDRGNNDANAAIDGYALTKWYDGGMPDQEKDWRKLYFWHDLPGEYYLEVGYSTDYVESETTANIVASTDAIPLDYVCILDHMPDIVVGTDNNDYYCILEHTAAAADLPITGANYATYWAATGGTGGGQTWVADTVYESNAEKRPVTGSNYLSYWRKNNTVGQGADWSAQSGYQAARPEFQRNSFIFLGSGGTALGSFILGTSLLGKYQDTQIEPVDLQNARGRAIRFMFRNLGTDEPFAIRGIKSWFTYVPEFPG